LVGVATAAPELVDDLDYASRARLHNDRTIIDISVAVSGSMILRGHFVVGHAAFRQYRADTEIFAIAI
jgi:hypothetical protein